MAGPWEKYSASSNDGPWAKYGGGPAAPERDEIDTWADAEVERERAIGLEPRVRLAEGIPIVGGLLDEGNALLESGLHKITGGRFGNDYDHALALQRARSRAADAESPIASMVGKTAVGLATGGTLLSRLAPAATTAGRLAHGVGIGGATGAVEGFTRGEGGIDKRVDSAMGGALVGGVLGGGLSGAAELGGRIAGHMAGARAAARAETDNASQGALTAIARGLERDRISPNDIAQQIRGEMADSTATAGRNRFWGNTSNRQPWTDEQIELVTRAAESGRSPERISQIMRRMDPDRQGPGAGAVRTIINETTERSRGPLNLVDRAGLVRTGSGDNTQMTLRAAAATPGEARSIAREALIERQIGANGRLQQAFDRLIGSGDYDGVAAQHSQTLQQAGDAAYAAARRFEAPFDLAPIFQAWRGRYEGRRGPVPEAILSALDSMTGRMPIRNPETGMVVGHQPRLPQTLQEFIDARQNLRAAIEAPGASNVVRTTLRQLRDDLSNEVRRTNPAWGRANDIWRDGSAAQDMLEAGARMSTRLNTRNREAIADFQAAQRAERAAVRANDRPAIEAARARQELFRVGLVRALNDELANKGATNDLTRTLRFPGARRMLETVLGRNQAAQLFRVVDAEHAMLRTHQSQFGSQTTPLKEAIDDLNWAPRFSSALELANPVKALQVGGEMIASRINASRNRSMMPLMTDTNTLRQMETLRALQSITGARTSARHDWGRHGNVAASMAGMLAGRGMAQR